MKKLIRKRKLFLVLVSLCLLIGVIFMANAYVKSHAKDYLYTQLNEIPAHQVGLVLGTSRYLKNGQENLYFRYRIDAAENLFRAGKVEYLLLSGDNRKRNYNEPEEMEKALLERGIPKDRIVLDYAGFRTLDSIIRAYKVFGQSSFIIVSQQFHNERALTIAHSRNIKAIAFNAQSVSRSYGLKTQLRELLARVKMLLDLYLFQTEPKFLGESIEIG